jgi:D-cysteine desulfhydrase
MGVGGAVARPSGTCHTPTVSALEPALFRRYPALQGRLPHRRFLSGSTPVEPLRIPGLGGAGLMVKRDDRSCAVYGGNKPRKLEFVIGSCLERGVRRLVTTGGLGTNHGLATAILGREAGLETTLVLVDQPVTEKVRESLLLFTAYGAEVVHGRNLPGTALQCLRILGRSPLRGERSALVPTGGSGALGNLGFVSAAFELAEQIRAGMLETPSEIFVPVGTGGTHVGLALGLRLAGVASRVVGVLVTDILPPSPARLARAARATLRRLRRADPSIPELALGPGDFPLITGQVGPGYGSSTPAADEAVCAAAEAGLRLETTYTGKCLAEIRERARRGTLGKGPILFWNTFNSVDVKERAPHSPDATRLPGSIRRLLE